MDKRTALESVLGTLTTTQKIVLWNNRCEEYNCYDDTIEFMDSFDELWGGWKPSEIVQRLGKNFYYGDEYYAFDGYGHAQSFTYLTDDNSPYDEDELLDFLLEHSDCTDLADMVEDNDLIGDFTLYCEENIPEFGGETCDDRVVFFLDKALTGWSLVTDDWEWLVSEMREAINNPEEDE